MKQWLKKLSQYEDPRQNQPQNENKNKKVIVSFQKHIQHEQNNQNTKQKNNPPIPNQEYQEDYHARSYSNLSKCVQIDQDDDSQQHNQGIKKSRTNNNNKLISNFYKKQTQRKDLQTNQKKQNPLSESHSNHESNSSENDEKKQVSQQIIDSFISMTNLIKLIKNIPDAKGEFITLKHINKILIQSSTINKSKLTNYLINKSSQGIEAYHTRLTEKQKINAYNRFAIKLKKKTTDSQDQQTKKFDQINKFYFRTFSNGLAHQYYPVRSLIWKISSSYLPDSNQKWIWKMEISLLKYRQLVKLHIIETFLKKKKGLQKSNQQKQKNLQVQKRNCEQQKSQILEIRKKSETFSDPLSRLNSIKKKEKDHPLNIKQNSKWKTYFQDFQLWTLIQKDTVRTRPSCTFFRQANVFSLTNDQIVENGIAKVQLQNGQKIDFRLNELHLSKSKKECTTYIDSMSRILFIYLKVNPQHKYYQGMNQLVAVIYYCLTNKNNEYFRRVSESDTYEIFTLLMNELNTYPSHVIDKNKLPFFNHFISGQKYFGFLKIMIKKYDFRLDQFLEQNKLYDCVKAISIRWFLTIFLTEFSLDEALILWDSIMVLIGNRNPSDNNRNSLKQLRLTEFMLYMALAVIHLNRNQIYSEDLQQKIDSSKILIIFQKIKQKPQEIIEKTLALYKSFPNLLE